MDILVSSDWLAQHINDVTILDASAHLPDAGRDPQAEFLASHLPGALYLDLPSLKDESSSIQTALPTAEQFAGRMCELGISAGDPIVLYDSSMLRSSARAFFIFSLFGYENVAILDGGAAKWLAEGRQTETGPRLANPSEFAAQSGDSKRVRCKQDMLANCSTRAEQVVDARDAARFTGETQDAVHGLPGGHIPGARNVHFVRLFNEDGTYKDAAGLQAAFVEAGVDLDQPVAASCGGGVTASVVLFAMQILGKRGALYDGSWSEWGADPATPKETGQVS